MNKQIVLLSVAIKTGVFSKGTKKGQPYRIGVCKWADASGRVTPRISPNPEASEAFIGKPQDGELKLLKTNPYKFNDITGKEVIASSKWCVVFAGEKEEQSIFAHGRQPLGFVAKTVAAPAKAGNEVA